MQEMQHKQKSTGHNYRIQPLKISNVGGNLGNNIIGTATTASLLGPLR